MFLVLAVVLLGTTFLFHGGAYEIQLHDTYFIISWASIFGYLGLFCCLLEGVYFWLQHRTNGFNKGYKIVHVLITVVSIGLLYYSQSDFLAISGIARRYSSTTDLAVVNKTFNLGASAIILFVAVQFCFLVVVLASLLRRQPAS